MPDSDPNRILIETSIGQVQAWKPNGDDTSICFALYAGVLHTSSKKAYVSSALYMTAAEARDLAVVLMQAADHVEAVTVVEMEDA